MGRARVWFAVAMALAGGRGIAGGAPAQGAQISAQPSPESAAVRPAQESGAGAVASAKAPGRRQSLVRTMEEMGLFGGLFTMIMMRTDDAACEVAIVEKGVELRFSPRVLGQVEQVRAGVRTGAQMLRRLPGLEAEVAKMMKEMRDYGLMPPEEPAEGGQPPTAAGPKDEAAQRQLRSIQMVEESYRDELARSRPEPQPGAVEDCLSSAVRRGDVTVSTRDTEDGIVLALTSESSEVAAIIREQAPAQVQAAQAFWAAQRLMMKWPEVMALLWHGKASVQVEDTQEGVSVSITSEAPEVAARIKQELPEAVEGFKLMAQIMDEFPVSPLSVPLIAMSFPEPRSMGLGQAARLAMAFSQLQRVLRIVASDTVTTSVEERDKGATVHIVSSDPQVVLQIKSEIPRVARRLQEPPTRATSRLDQETGAGGGQAAGTGEK